MRKNARIAMAAIGGAACLAAALWPLARAVGKAADGGAQAAGQRPVTVITQQVRPEPGHLSRRMVAVLRPRSETPHAFQVPGRVRARLVQIGDPVGLGQEIALLDRSDYDLVVRQAEAEVAAATEALAVAHTDEDRALSLRESGVISTSGLDGARRSRQEARSRLDRAQAQLDIATNALAYATLRAGTEGIVTGRDIEPGQIVAAGQVVLRIAETTGLDAETDLPETLYARRDRISASFTPWGAPDRSIAVVLREVSPLADPATHMHRARFALPEDQAAGLAFGNTGWLTLDIANEGAGLTRLPSAALFDDGTGGPPAVWRVEGDRLRRLPVTVRRLEGDSALVQIAAEGDLKIVALGANRLRDGQQVHAIERAPE